MGPGASTACKSCATIDHGAVTISFFSELERSKQFYKPGKVIPLFRDTDQLRLNSQHKTDVYSQKRTFCTLSMLNHSARGESIISVQQVQNAFFGAGRIICVSRMEMLFEQDIFYSRLDFSAQGCSLRSSASRTLQQSEANEDDILSQREHLHMQSYLFCDYHFHLVG